MAESSALLPSDTPPIENLGFEPLIHGKACVDPIATYSIQPSGSSKNAPDAGNGASLDGEDVTPREEVELGNSIERELLRLTITQAEIEAAQESLGTDDEAPGKDVRSVKNEDADNVGDYDEEENEGVGVGVGTRDGHVMEEKDVKNAESAEQENENKRGGMEDGRNVERPQGDEVAKFSIQSRSNNPRRRINYPMRPDAEDCAYYMKFGSCKFGFTCKFNHPPRRKNQIKDKGKNREENTDKAGQTECKYYLTSEGCRYGKDCKYSHGYYKSSPSHNPEFNFLGLPIRPGEKECPYYMRTGSCKYGLSCRFHHPDLKTVSGGGSPSGYGDDGTTSTKEWNGYQGSTYPTSEKSLPTPPALAMNNLPTEISLPSQHKRAMAAEEYPERPGEPECSFFIKTGGCKFKSNCKFHHPKSSNSHAKVNSLSFNENGLPLRPDQPVCTYYHRYGICKYGPTCKYDHSSKFASIDRAEAERMGQGNETES